MGSDGGCRDPRSVGDLSWEERERLSVEQQALHPSIDRINRWAVANTGVFAGVWLDNDAFLLGTGPVRIAVGVAHRSLHEVAAELKDVVDDPSQLSLVKHEHTEAVLRTAQHDIVERMQKSSDGRVTGCGVDVPANRLEVMLRAPDAPLEAELRAAVGPLPLTVVYGHLSWG